MLSYSKLSNSLILPCLIWLKKILESIPDDKEYLKSMKLFIKDNFEKKWLCNRHLALSCILQKNFSLKSSFNFYKSTAKDIPAQPRANGGQNISVINYNNPTINMNFNSSEISA